MIENPKFLNRLQKEYSNITTSQSLFKVSLIDEDIQHWLVTFTGPEDTAYAGLEFRLEITIPVGHFTIYYMQNRWPLEIPDFVFLSKVFHPNVYSSGRICLDVIQSSAYSPAATLEGQLNNILLLLQNPNCDSPANGRAATVYRNSYKEFCETVKREHRKCISLFQQTHNIYRELISFA